MFWSVYELIAPIGNAPTNLSPKLNPLEWNQATLTVDVTKEQINVNGYYGWLVDDRWIQNSLSLNRAVGILEQPKLEWCKIWIDRKTSYFSYLPFSKGFVIPSGSRLEVAVGYGSVPSQITEIPTDYVEEIVDIPPTATAEKDFIITVKTRSSVLLIPNLINLVYSSLNYPLSVAGYILTEVTATDTNEIQIKIRKNSSIELTALIPIIIAALVTIAVVVVSITIKTLSTNATIKAQTIAKEDIIKAGLDNGLSYEQIKGLLDEVDESTENIKDSSTDKLINMIPLVIGGMLLINLTKK